MRYLFGYYQNMKSLNTIKKELIAKAKKQWIWENFWENELRQFIDEYQKKHKFNLFVGEPRLFPAKHLKTYYDIIAFSSWAGTYKG